MLKLFRNYKFHGIATLALLASFSMPSHAGAGSSGGGHGMLQNETFKFYDLSNFVTSKAPKVKSISRGSYKAISITEFNIKNSPGFAEIQKLAAQNPYLKWIASFAETGTAWVSTNGELKELNDVYVKSADREKSFKLVPVAIENANVVMVQETLFPILGENPVFQAAAIAHETIRSIGDFSNASLSTEFVQEITEALINNQVTPAQAGWLHQALGILDTNPTDYRADIELAVRLIRSPQHLSNPEQSGDDFLNGKMSAGQELKFLRSLSNEIQIEALSPYKGCSLHSSPAELDACVRAVWSKFHPKDISRNEADRLSLNLDRASFGFLLETGADITNLHDVVAPAMGEAISLEETMQITQEVYNGLNTAFDTQMNSGTSQQAHEILELMGEFTHYLDLLQAKRLNSMSSQLVDGSAMINLSLAGLKAAGYEVKVRTDTVLR